jgi:hypothetical protein
MRYYKDTNNKLFAFEDNTTEEIITRVESIHKTTLTKITKEEYDTIKSPTIKEVKKVKKQQVENTYQEAIQKPIEYNGNIFQADKDSQDILTKVITSAPSGFTINWLDINNNIVNMTLDDLKGLAQAILVRGQQLFAKKVQLKKQVDNASTIKEVKAIVW